MLSDGQRERCSYKLNGITPSRKGLQTLVRVFYVLRVIAFALSVPNFWQASCIAYTIARHQPPEIPNISHTDALATMNPTVATLSLHCVACNKLFRGCLEGRPHVAAGTYVKHADLWPQTLRGLVEVSVT